MHTCGKSTKSTPKRSLPKKPTRLHQLFFSPRNFSSNFRGPSASCVHDIAQAAQPTSCRTLAVTTLGLFAAGRVSPAAYWAAWADALPVLRQRYPEAAARLVQELEGEPAAPCLRAAAEAARQITAEGWTSRPEWASCARGADAPAAEGELGLGNPGWQRHAVLIVAARRRKVARYPELTRGEPQRLVVLAAEVGGRWSDECQQFLRTLLRLRVQRAPPPLRAAAAQGWARRWWSVLSVAPSPAPRLESGP